MKWNWPIIPALGLFFLVLAAQADWTPAQQLTENAGSSFFPTIAVDSTGRLHVVWSDETPGNSEIYYMKSIDGGATWETSQRLTTNEGVSLAPVIAVDPFDILHVVWYDSTPGNSEIYYMKSIDGGTNWGTARRLTSNSGPSAAPAIAADPSGGLHVAWCDGTPGNSEIYYKKSADGGTTWTTKRRLTSSSVESKAPDIAVDPFGNPHVVWHEKTSGNDEIYYKKSPDGGTTWSASQRLTQTPGNSRQAQIAADSSGNLHVVHMDNTPGNFEIFYRKSTNGGAAWSTSLRLVWKPGYSRSPAIAVESADNLHVVWQDNAPGNSEIYYKDSTDGGNTWTQVKKKLTLTSGESVDPDVAVDFSGNLHVVWHDNTPGNYEIYYMKFVN